MFYRSYVFFVHCFFFFLSGCSNKRWGADCSNECNCEDEEEQCHYRYGSCDDSGCKAGSKGDGCDEGKSITPSRDHEVFMIKEFIYCCDNILIRHFSLSYKYSFTVSRLCKSNV